jgi:hypothetical protein
MTKERAYEQSAADVASAVVGERHAALAAEDLTAEVEIQRWSEGNAELRVSFRRGGTLVDVLEDFVVKEGRPVSDLGELRRWVNDAIDEVIAESAHS